MAEANLFKCGWRPFIGWTCGAALCWYYLVQPVILFSLLNTGHDAKEVDVDIGDLMTLITALLGLGGLRTVEKIKGKE